MHSLAEKYAFLLENLHLSPAQFVLKYQAQYPDQIKLLAQQLNGLRRMQKKNPIWFENSEVCYPPQVNLEQSSSQLTAAYKIGLLSQGKLSLDLTCGMGVDSYYFSQHYDRHIGFEINPELQLLSAHNLAVLGCNNAEIHPKNGIEWLANWNGKADLIYVDPSRRADSQRKYKIEDCLPDVALHQHLLLEKSNEVLLKISPFMDIHQLIDRFPQLFELHILSVKNDCKELLLRLNSGTSKGCQIICSNILADEKIDTFHFNLAQEKAAQPSYSPALKYIYEPNSSLLKSGAFRVLSSHYQLAKLHPNTHLYTSDHLCTVWQGRIFKVMDSPISGGNCLSRNHPMTPAQLKKKFNIKSGNEVNFLLAFTDVEKPKTRWAKVVARTPLNTI